MSGPATRHLLQPCQTQLYAKIQIKAKMLSKTNFFVAKFYFYDIFAIFFIISFARATFRRYPRPRIGYDQDQRDYTREKCPPNVLQMDPKWGWPSHKANRFHQIPPAREMTFLDIRSVSRFLSHSRSLSLPRTLTLTRYFFDSLYLLIL